MQEECPICFQETSILAALAPCGHIVCNDCWFGYYSMPPRKKCPLCRIRVLTQDEIDVWDWTTYTKTKSNPYRLNPPVPFVPFCSDDEEKCIFYRQSIFYPQLRPDPGEPRFFLKKLCGERQECRFFPTFWDLKLVYGEACGYNPNQLRLIFKGQPMADSWSIRDRVQEGEVVHCIVQMRGDIGHFSQTGLLSHPPSTVGACPGVVFLNAVLEQHHCRTLCGMFELVWGEHELDLQTIVASVGMETVEKIRALVEFDVIKVRRVQAGCGFIPFHYDQSCQTLQVFLNPDTDYEGGRVLFQSEQGLYCPPRSRGCGTFHDNSVFHGVTSLTKGTRVSLFFIKT